MARWWRIMKGRDDGSAAVEFALIAPVLVLMLIAVVDLGLVMIDNVRLSSAVRAGAQFAMQDPDDKTSIRTVAVNATTLTIDPADITVSDKFCECDGVVSACDTTCASGFAPGEYVTVTATTTVTSILSYPWLPSPTTLSQSTTIRVE